MILSFIKDLQTLRTKSINKEAIPFQALRESVKVTLHTHAHTHLPKNDMLELIKHAK